jgi:zinc D-Ala-D-Ala carboxypeptidase
MRTTYTQEQLKNMGWFGYEKILYSSIAQQNQIDNFPGSDFIQTSSPELSASEIILSLHRLFKYCINPIFRKFYRNLSLTSVYRNKEVNKKLGGVENSQHIYGYAADIVITDGTPTSTLFNWCRFNIPEYHQLIWEYPERGTWSESSPSFSWVHISYIKGDNFKTNSVSSTNPKIHKAYQDENTFYIDNFTHKISLANEQLLTQ